MALMANRTFVVPPRRVIKRGDRLKSNDPAVKGRKEFFDPVDDVVEQATAAPGEKRTRAKKPAAKK